jgi:mycofactocin precursor
MDEVAVDEIETTVTTMTTVTTVAPVEDVATEVLVEEVSIDGMCGVY